VFSKTCHVDFVIFVRNPKKQPTVRSERYDAEQDKTGEEKLQVGTAIASRASPHANKIIPIPPLTRAMALVLVHPETGEGAGACAVAIGDGNCT
jgi:hypothetical protein